MIIRNLKIRWKMVAFTTISVCLILVVWLLTLFYTTKTSIGSDLYNEIMLSNELTADILPPPEYVIESYALALQYITSDDPSEQSNLEIRCADLETTYNARYVYWQKKLPRDAELQQVFLGDSYQAATDFYKIFRNKVIPAVQSRDKGAIQQAQKDLQEAYERQRTAVDETVKLSQKWQENISLESKQIQKQTRIFEFALVMLAVLLNLMISFVIIHSMAAHLRYVTTISERIAEGDLSQHIDQALITKDETG